MHKYTEKYIKKYNYKYNMTIAEFPTREVFAVMMAIGFVMMAIYWVGSGK